MALTYTPEPKLNSVCSDFQLLGVDGNTYSLQEFKIKNKAFNGILIMFICNHCPYVKAIEDRLITLGHDLKKMDISVVGICSNDPLGYPEDSFENLKARWLEKKYSFIYLHDADQKVARDFGAVCTPDFFLFNSKLELYYRGRLDDSWKDSSQVTQQELLIAAKAMLSGKAPPEKQNPSMGCSIKWIK